jgi:hypothetical protein
MSMQRIELSVGEPWDFSSPDGDNFLRCTCDLDKYSGQTDGGDYILVDCTPFQDKGHLIDSLRLTPRYEPDSNVLIQRIRNGEMVPVNASYLKNGMKWTNELAQAADKDVRQYWGSFLIGGAILNPPGVKRRNSEP